MQNKQKKIRALVVEKLGDPTKPVGSGVLKVDRQFPAPALPPHGIRIRTTAASLNFADMLQVAGQYQEKPKLPYVPGSEVSGVVTEVGADVKTFRTGDTVAAVLWGGGGFAEECVVAETSAIRLPKGIDIAAAAGLPVAFGTAHLALIERGRLQAGQVLLVTGAAGGVGIAAVQIGKLLGAKVIAVARGKEKTSLLQSLGATHVIDSGAVSKPLRARIRKLAPQGVDVVLDTVGGTTFDEALKTVRWGAHLLIIGFASGAIPKVAANIALVKNLTVHGVYWGSYAQHRPRLLRKSLEDSVQWLAEGKVKVPISHRFALEEAHKAFAALQSRRVLGKLLLTPNGVGKPQSRL